MRLQAEPPPRIFEAIGNGRLDGRLCVWAVHGLEEEVLDIEVTEALRHGERLWID